MPETTPRELRIYCICGQKMKVSEAMFGLPGKCVACRQKIRIPRASDLPPGAEELFLRDHPEFLRKSRRKGSGRHPRPAANLAEKEPESAPETPEIVLGETLEPSAPIALDILEPLRVLCSIKEKVKRQLKRGMPADGLDMAALKGFLDRVRSMRADLDEQLRQRLMEVVIELAGTQERIVQAGLSARLGEIEFKDFRTTADQLRRRRDILERLQQNIKGWLSVTDPHQAGGYANVSLDSLPNEKIKLSLPIERPDPRPLMEQHITGLRDALARRERAERRLAETRRVEAEGRMSVQALADCRADCEAEKARAEGEVTFRRKRLETVTGDAAADILTIEAHLETVRNRYRGGGYDKAHFQALELELLQAQRDCAKVEDWVTRALAASAAKDVPHAQGTFLERLAKARGRFGGTVSAGAESWIAWGAAFLFGASVFLPVIDDVSLLEGFRLFRSDPLHWLMAVPVVFGLAAALAPLIRGRELRGLTLIALWLVLTVGGAILFHEAQYGYETVAVRFRQGQPYLLRGGIVALLLADAALLVSAGMTLYPEKRLRSVPAVAVIAALTALVAVFTNLGGYWESRPSLTAKSIQRFVENRLTYDTSVLIKNGGGRELCLNTPSPTGRNVYQYALERFETDQWVPGENPVNVLSDSDTAYRDYRGGGITVAARETTVLQYRLPPGKYRVRLTPVWDADQEQVREFTLEAPAPRPLHVIEPATAAVGEGVPGASDTVAENSSGAELSPTPGQPLVARHTEVELRGVIVGNNQPPRFSMVLHFPNGTTQPLDILVGDTVYAPWSVTEYNSMRQTVTLSDGEDRILILERGQRVSLD